MGDTNTAVTDAQLAVRRRAAVAFLAYAYLAAAYRESPSASGLHEQFVRWYVVNRGLYGVDDATLQAMERAQSTRLTSQLGYTQISGYALGVALSSVGPAFSAVWRNAPPTSAAGLPAWLDANRFWAAAETVPGLDTLDARISTTMDPVRAPLWAGDAAAAFVSTGGIPLVNRDAPTPGAELPTPYGEPGSGKPAGGSGGGVMTYQPGGDLAPGPGTQNAQLAPLNTRESLNTVLVVAGVGVSGFLLYYLAKRVKK